MAQDNRLAFDKFSVVHAALGAVAELSRIPAPVAIGAQVLFEIVENPIKERVAHIWPDARPDGWQNQVGDVVSFTAGFYGARLVKHVPAGAFAAIALAAVAGAIWTESLLVRPHQPALR